MKTTRLVLHARNLLVFHFFNGSFTETPLSLQSTCRLVIRQSLGLYNLDKVDDLGLVSPFDDFVAFRELFISAPTWLQHDSDTHIPETQAIAKANKVLKEVTREPPKRGKFAHCPMQALMKRIADFTAPEQTDDETPMVPREEEVVAPPPAPPQNGAAAPPPPPPPPPPPMPPRPGFWRFPGAEGIKRNHVIPRED